MAWWGALTQQFGELAANAMKDLPAAAAQAAAAAGVPSAEPVPPAPARRGGSRKTPARPRRAR